MKYSILEDPRYRHIAEPKSILFQIFSFIFDLYANTVLTFYTPVKVIGRENIPKDKPFIFVSNHNSHMDIAILAYATRMGYEKFGFLAAKDYWFDNNFRRRFFKPYRKRNKWVNWVGLNTLIKREVGRFFAVYRQTVLPGLITTALYIAIFGFTLEQRISEIQGVPYTMFILPGLIMMNTLTNATSNTASSMLQMKLLQQLPDLLTAPLSGLEIALAYIIGGAVRGMVNGCLLYTSPSPRDRQKSRMPSSA